MPTTLTLKVAAGHSINKYNPKFPESSGSESPGTNRTTYPSQVKSVSMSSIFEASNVLKIILKRILLFHQQ